MSALTASSVQVAPRPASGSPALDPSVAGLLPVADGLWQEIYHVIAPIDDAGIAQLWRAYRTDTAAEVVLRVLPGVKGDARTEAWTRLCAIDLPCVQKAIEVHYVGSHRVEIYGALKGIPLDQWRSKRSSVDVATVETVVRQLSEALGILHANGLAHLGMQPKVVFLHEDKSGLQCTLGGLGSVVRFEGEKLIPALVNPLYAPPEAATLQLHEPGPAICGWDWWTLGRVVQELLLGHHVMDDLPDAEAAQSEQLRWARAEALLLEQEMEGLRAGAVEVMKIDERLTVLLRGLLASSPEGRWGGEFVDRWLRHQLVKENYSDRRAEHKFRWRGRLYTVPEAAKELQSADLWSEAAAHVFKTTAPGRLAHFIANMPEQHLLHKQLGELLKFATTETIRVLPTNVSRELILMLALLQLSGEKLFWQGRRITGESLAGLLAEEPNNPERFAFVRILTDRSISAQIERYDLEAGRSLAAAGLLAADTEALLQRLGWLPEKKAQDSDAIFRLTLASEANLKEAHGRLKQIYACANDPTVEKIFKNEKPARSELVALAWIEPKADSLGFVTHQQLKALRLAEMTERCGQLVRLISWQKLEKALKAGPLVFGQRPLILAVWLGLVPLLAVLKPGPLGLLLGLLPFGLLVSLRLVHHHLLSSLIKPWSTVEKPMGWDGHFARCREEISRLVRQHALPLSLAESTALYRRINSERNDLAKPEPCEPIAPPARHTGTLLVSAAGWVLVVSVVAGSVAWAVKTPPDFSAHQKEWHALFASAPKAKVKPKEEPPVTQISWPYKAPNSTPFEITTYGAFNPDSAQAKFATERAHELVKGYKPETIDSFVAIYVPLEGANGGLLLYDGKKGAFMGRNGVLINFVPMPKMWMQIGDQRAIFIEK